MSSRLNQYKTGSTEFYYQRVQIFSYKGWLYQHQLRFHDSFGTDLIGHFLVDENEYEVKMQNDSLQSFRAAIESITELRRKNRATLARKRLRETLKSNP